MGRTAALALSLCLAGCYPYISPADHQENMGVPHSEDTGSTIPLDDTGREDDTGEDTGSTSTLYPEPWFLVAGAGFGYDAGTNEIREFTTDDNGAAMLAPPTLMLQLWEEGTGIPGPVICTILIRQESPVQANDLGDSAVRLGWMVDWGAASVEHDCEGKLDPAKWGTDLGESLADAGLGVGITGPADESLRATAQNQAEANDLDFEALYAPWMVGARMYLHSLGTAHNGSQEFWYARGMQVDADFGVLWNDLNSDLMWQQDVEPPAFIPAEDLLAGETLPTGAYLVDPAYLLNWGGPLDETLLP